MATYKLGPQRSARRDPRVYVITADQTDFRTADEFINTLRYLGVEVHQATAPLAANGRPIPWALRHQNRAGRRAHVIDMFEPQDHPNDMDERGIPRRPYDNAGWTLAYQMGVKFDRLFDDVTGRQGDRRPRGTRAEPVSITAAGGTSVAGDQRLVHDCQSRDEGDTARFYRYNAPLTSDGRTYPAGTLYVAANATSTPIVQKAVQELGVTIHGDRFRAAGATRSHPHGSRCGIRSRVDALGVTRSSRTVRVPVLDSSAARVR